MLSRSRKFGNDTIDVANKGCWEPYDTLACLRTALLTTASAITLVFIIVKIIKYHLFRNTRMHHYAIFYTSAIECIVWWVSKNFIDCAYIRLLINISLNSLNELIFYNLQHFKFPGGEQVSTNWTSSLLPKTGYIFFGLPPSLVSCCKISGTSWYHATCDQSSFMSLSLVLRCCCSDGYGGCCRIMDWMSK